MSARRANDNGEKVLNSKVILQDTVLEVFHVCKTFQDIVPEWLSPVFSIPLKVLACITNLPSPPAPVFTFFRRLIFTCICQINLLHINWGDTPWPVSTHNSLLFISSSHSFVQSFCCATVSPIPETQALCLYCFTCSYMAAYCLVHTDYLLHITQDSYPLPPHSSSHLLLFSS